MFQVYKISVNHKEFMSARSCLYMKEITEIKLNLVQLILKKAGVKCRSRVISVKTTDRTC